MSAKKRGRVEVVMVCGVEYLHDQHWRRQRWAQVWKDAQAGVFFIKLAPSDRESSTVKMLRFNIGRVRNNQSMLAALGVTVTRSGEEEKVVFCLFILSAPSLSANQVKVISSRRGCLRPRPTVWCQTSHSFTAAPEMRSIHPSQDAGFDGCRFHPGDTESRHTAPAGHHNMLTMEKLAG